MKSKILSQPLFFYQVLYVKTQSNIFYVTKEITQTKFLSKSRFFAIRSANHQNISTKISIANINHFVRIATYKTSIFSFELPNKDFFHADPSNVLLT